MPQGSFVVGYIGVILYLTACDGIHGSQSSSWVFGTHC